MATGFHGFHVLVGTIFLIVCLIRAYAGHFTPTQHLGFEFAAWYWHFVDVVWLFLFICIYVWGTGGGHGVGARGAVAAGQSCYKGRPQRPPFLFRQQQKTSMPDETLPTLAESALRGLACRCPRCGKGKLYSGFLTCGRAARPAGSTMPSSMPATGRRSSSS